MKYISTRGETLPVGFQEAVLGGLARDGGLLLPESIPDVRGRLDEWVELPYQALASEIIGLFSDLPAPLVRELVAKSYSVFTHPEITPVSKAGPMYLLELFHGPTLAFKDVALQLLGNLFEHFLEKTGGELTLLAATSGDTGSAAIHAARGRRRMRIFVLFPRGRVSPTQERQMTTVPDGNVVVAAVDGDFDDCQLMVKTLFRDLPFRDRFSLGSVNSINWARILAQVVYYFYAALKVMRETGAARVRFAVPTGNFGDIFAGYMAWRMGLPVGRLVLAVNDNDILARFFESGDYARSSVKPSLSPSMDIQAASNFERYLYYRLGSDPAAVRAAMRKFDTTGRISAQDLPCSGGEDIFAAGRAGDAETLETIRGMHESYGRLIDPHTAVAAHVAARHLDAAEPMICLATAHPAKFSRAIELALGKNIARHPALDALEALPSRCARLEASADALRSFIAGATPANTAP